MRSDPNIAGARAELEVAAALVRAGHDVFVPLFGAHGRVDLIITKDKGVPRRVQVKTARLVSGAIAFRVCSNTGNEPRDYRGQVDAFGVYAPALGDVFLVPVDDVATRLCHLRLTPARNGQSKGVRWAAAYRLAP